jgi:hypothetical protein
MTSASLRVATALALLSLATAALAAPRRARAPVSVRIEGYVGAKPSGVRLLASWKVNRGRDVYQLHVTKLQVLSGDTAYFNIISRLEPYPVAFALAGDSAALATFATTPPDHKIAIKGYLRLDVGTRILMVSTVEAMKKKDGEEKGG